MQLDFAATFVNDVARVLKPGGRILFDAESSADLENLEPALKAAGFEEIYKEPTNEGYRLAAQLSRQGAKVIDTEVVQVLTEKDAVRLLTDTFGLFRTIEQGKMEWLTTKEMEETWDVYYGVGDWAEFANAQSEPVGFAIEGASFIDRERAGGLTTAIHEILHNNTHADYYGVVGGRFTEGTTEYLTQRAVGNSSLLGHFAYLHETLAVEDLISAGLPVEALERAYLQGGAEQLIAEWADRHCVGTWTEIRTALEDHEWNLARALMRPLAQPERHLKEL